MLYVNIALHVHMYIHIHMHLNTCLCKDTFEAKKLVEVVASRVRVCGSGQGVRMS